jgi:hypothetical protein
MEVHTASNRGLARQLGVSETAVRRAERAGRIGREPDGAWGPREGQGRVPTARMWRFPGTRPSTTPMPSGQPAIRRDSRSRPASPRSGSRATSTGPLAAAAIAISGSTRMAARSSAPSGRAMRAMPACRASAARSSTSRLARLRAQRPPDPGATRNVAADELTWFAIEVVE